MNVAKIESAWKGCEGKLQNWRSSFPAIIKESPTRWQFRCGSLVGRFGGAVSRRPLRHRQAVSCGNFSAVMAKSHVRAGDVQGAGLFAIFYGAFLVLKKNRGFRPH